MITFSKYTEIVNAIATKLKTTKDAANNALIKAQQKGIDPLKWQKNLTILKSFIQIVADYDPSIDERLMTDKQQVGQMNHYWKNMSHPLVSDKEKKKSMDDRFGIKNIKLDKYGNIISFDKYKRGRFEDIDYEKDHGEEKR
jgi:hypothetical protein